MVSPVTLKLADVGAFTELTRSVPLLVRVSPEAAIVTVCAAALVENEPKFNAVTAAMAIGMTTVALAVPLALAA